MSIVTTFNPSALNQVTMTGRAQEHAKKTLAGTEHKGIRLAVKPAGCSGYKYELEYVSAPSASDLHFMITDGVDVYVDEGSLSLVKGTEIDFVTEGLNQFFTFRNPNSQGECGCGESFTVSG